MMLPLSLRTQKLLAAGFSIDVMAHEAWAKEVLGQL